MKRLEDQVVLITGSTDGLGLGTARVLAMKGATVLLHGRDGTKLQKVERDLTRETGNVKIHSYLADLSSLAEVQRLASEVQQNDRLDMLINNAAIGFGDPKQGRQLSQGGCELRFAVNYLAPYVLTNLLVPWLLRSVPSRIVNVASLGQEAIDFENVMLDKGYSGVRAYRQSKTALIMFTFDLAKRLRADRVTVNCLHPATYMDTNMVREAGIEPHSSVRSGIEAVMHVAASPDLDGVTGRYFDRLQEARAIAQAYDPEARTKLRMLSERLTGVALT
jgi:NAD(P)-dependent dehydrogenase (short-subunit alcohol dehydrogenase family)